MIESHLILGGIRSGKSQYGLDHANQLAAQYGLQKIFLATAENFDSSMKTRIMRHQNTRSPDWQLAEIPIKIDEFILNAPDNCLILLDCLTLWLNNLLHYQHDVAKSIGNLIAAIQNSQAKQTYLLMIGNELGHSPIHENALTRNFVDKHGEMNQELAKIANHVTFIIAGCPQILKS